MNDKNETIEKVINHRIFTVRGIQVMLDSDLAEIYGVETKVFNQAVKRNEERFPEDFRFQLTDLEFKTLRSQIVTSNRGGRRYLPYVFTEQGVSMLSAVLKSPTAIDISIKIIKSFVNMRKILQHNGDLFSRVETIEKRQIAFEGNVNEKFDRIFDAIEQKDFKLKQGIFYNGQIFDAYKFVADIIKNATKSIYLIDNYVDESILVMFGKNDKIKYRVYTKNITPQLKLDAKKYNSQYNNLDLICFDKSHDRFLIVDGKEVYHIGASLKDLGKKWFAFSKMDEGFIEILKKLW